MVEKRRMSTRYGGERPPQRRRLTPSPPAAPATPSRRQSQTGPGPQPASSPTSPGREKGSRLQRPRQARVAAVADAEKALPFRVVDKQPMPTVAQPQAAGLLDSEYKTIRQSRVLAAALHRSRLKWILDGVFDRYWTKPSRRKQPADEADKNPAKDSMKLIGHGKLTIEPHLFDVTLYGVRELSIAKVPGQVPSALQQPPASQQPLYRPAGPMHGAGGHAPGPTRPTDTLLVQKAAMPATPASNISSVPATTVPPHQQQHQEHHQHHQQHQQHQQLQHQQHQQLQHQQPPPANSDPVIHMLAQRAGQDAELKAVMKIVAAGDASPEQLQFFQRHIDELSSLLQARTAAGLPQIPGLLAAGGLGPSPRHVGTRPTSPTSDCRASSVGTLTAPQNASNPAKGRQPSLSRMYPYHSSSSPLAGMKGRAAVSVAKADHFSAVVVEFAGGTGDRFLFPRHTILEYLPAGRQVIASFLVVRDGSKAESDGYKPNKEYYQPVTISLTADDARVLSHLSRVVAWPDETRRHMDAVMDRAALANKVYLAMRLPKNPNQEEVLDLRDEAYFDATLSRSMTPVSMAPVRKPRGPYKKRVKIIDERDAGLNPSTPQ